MGASIRVIARLDIKGPNLIKGIQFDGYRVLGCPKEFAKTYCSEGIDEFIYQDTVSSLYQRNSLLDFIKTTASNIFIPFTVAGGIRTIEDIRKVLRAGADKVAINTAAVRNPTLLKEAVKIFGSQCIVSSIDFFRKDNGDNQVWVDYGRQPTDLNLIDWVREVVDCGVGEILLTSIKNEGMGTGYDLELTHKISSLVPIPVIACGGAGCKEDFSKAVIDGGADAVAAASVFHYNYLTPVESFTMRFNEKKLRMGTNIDSGNIDFLKYGYGGQQAIMVTPTSIREVKEHMLEKNISVRMDF